MTAIPHTTDAGRYDQSSADSRQERNSARDALHDLENELSAPAPGRARHWASRVARTVDTFLDALNAQAETDIADGGLLSEIAEDHPQLRPRIAQLRADHASITDEMLAVRRRLARLAEPELAQANVDNIRNQISEIARQYRRHRCLEADLVYEATNVEFGVSD